MQPPSLLGFPIQGDYSKEIEKYIGVYSDLKKSISLNQLPSGFLINYLLSTSEPIKELLNSYQFEELVGIIYENEGWKIERTKKTRDNGMDAIATRRDKNGNKIIAYIEAKNPPINKVNVSLTNKFIANAYKFGQSLGRSDTPNIRLCIP